MVFITIVMIMKITLTKITTHAVISDKVNGYGKKCNGNNNNDSHYNDVATIFATSICHCKYLVATILVSYHIVIQLGVLMAFN